MPLVKVNELLHHATENGYGVAAVNVFNYETIKWVAEAANRERIPVIIQFYPGFDKYIANIATEYFRACYHGVVQHGDPTEKNGDMFRLMMETSENAIDFVRGKMRLLNPNKFTF